MVKVVKLRALRDDANEELTPEGHWVELVFENDFGRHTIELNGARALPGDPILRAALEFMLWDYGLLEQQDSKTPAERVRVAQRLFNEDKRNHTVARAYLDRLGASIQ